MTPPESILARVRWLAENPGHPEAYLAVRALADEYEEWTSTPQTYVPREVLAATAKELFLSLEYIIITFHGMAGESIDDARNILDGQCPAWFVLADWERMTGEERAACWRWVQDNLDRLRECRPSPRATFSRNVGTSENPVWEEIPVLDLSPGSFLTLPAGADAQAGDMVLLQQELTEMARRRLRDFATAERSADRHNWLAGELSAGGHVPEGWRLEWVDHVAPFASGPDAGRSHHLHSHSERSSFSVFLDPVTYTRETPATMQGRYGPGTTVNRETVRTYVGRCEHCRTVFATRPTVEERGE